MLNVNKRQYGRPNHDLTFHKTNSRETDLDFNNVRLSQAKELLQKAFQADIAMAKDTKPVKLWMEEEVMN